MPACLYYYILLNYYDPRHSYTVKMPRELVIPRSLVFLIFAFCSFGTLQALLELPPTSPRLIEARATAAANQCRLNATRTQPPSDEAEIFDPNVDQLVLPDCNRVVCPSSPSHKPNAALVRRQAPSPGATQSATATPPPPPPEWAKVTMDPEAFTTQWL